VLSKKTGIDLGTSTVLIYVKGEGIVINEPLLVAVNRDGARILAVGRQALEMVGRAPETSNEISEAIQKPLRLIVGAVRDVLEETPPELAADIFDRGIVLSGGSSQLHGLDRYIAMHTGIPAVVADDPQTSVVRSTGLALEHFEVLKRNEAYLR
jgi:rod shape-determining protein MreB